MSTILSCSGLMTWCYPRLGRRRQQVRRATSQITQRVQLRPRRRRSMCLTRREVIDPVEPLGERRTKEDFTPRTSVSGVQRLQEHSEEPKIGDGRRLAADPESVMRSPRFELVEDAAVVVPQGLRAGAQHVPRRERREDAAPDPRRDKGPDHPRSALEIRLPDDRPVARIGPSAGDHVSAERAVGVVAPRATPRRWLAPAAAPATAPRVRPRADRCARGSSWSRRPPRRPPAAPGPAPRG